MLELRDFPNCCTMQVIVGFGGTDVAGARLATNPSDRAELATQIETLCTQARRSGKAIVHATTNNEQTEAVAALRESGFAHSRWAEKTQHPETTVRSWYKRLNPQGIDR